MTFGESLYLALVLAGFFAFAVCLIFVAHRTEGFLRDKAAAESRALKARDQVTQNAL